MSKLRSLRLRILVPAVLALTASAVHAQSSTWAIDPAHSGVNFEIRHLGVSNVRGAFHKVTGTVKLDEKDITHSSVEALIDTTTVNTDEPKRDEHLKSPEFFNIAKYPLHDL